MRTTFTKVFVNHPHILSEMLSLRLQGWHVRTLATIYHVDKSSIKHQCREFGIEPLGIAREIPKRPRQAKVSVSYVRREPEIDPRDKINPGKSYAEYLRDSQKRRYVSR